MIKKNWKILLGEFIASAFISFWGLGLLVPFAVTGDIGSLHEFSLWFGIAFAVTVIAFAPVSGVHVNPAVSLSWATFGDFKHSLVPFCAISQIMGWAVGIVPVYFIYNDALSRWASETGGNPATLFYCAFPEGQVISASITEIIMTSMLTFTIFLFLDKRIPNKPTPALFPVAIGIVIAFIIAFSGGYTGACINPARDLGPRITGYIYGLLCGYDVSGIFGSGQWMVYIASPLIGALLGGVLHYGVIIKLLPQMTEGKES